MNHKQNAEQYFTEELASIQNKEIKEFVLDVFEKLTPDYFWTVPCSTSGKYHPQVSLGVGGLIRHTKLAVWWGVELSRAMEMKQYHDEVVATLLLHDLVKNGEGLDSDGRPLDCSVTGTHGVTLAEKISKLEIEISIDIVDSYHRIRAGIALHMGVWTTKIYNTIEITGVGEFIDLIHLADYCASRKVDAEMLKLNGLKVGDSDGS